MSKTRVAAQNTSKDTICRILTIAPDGDRIDVLLPMGEPAFPGCAVRARLIDVIEEEQLDGKDKIRNDRLIAVAEANHQYANIQKLKDLP